MSKLEFLKLTFDEQLEAAWNFHNIEKAVFEREVAELKAKNEKLREALAAERERCAKIAEQARDDTCDGPVAWSMADSIAAAIRGNGDE